MNKQTIVDKLAKKSFEGAAVQKSWQAHMQAFGPILEPAFAENYQARIDLTSASPIPSLSFIEPMCLLSSL